MLFIGIRNEIRKLFSLKFYLACGLFFAFIPLIFEFLSIFSNKLFGIKINDAALSSHSLMMKYVLPFLAIILCIRIFSIDYTNNRVLCTLLRPISKGRLYMSKVIAITIYSFFIISLNVFFSILMNMITEGLEANYIARGFIALILSIGPIFTIVLLASVVTQLIKTRILSFIVFYLILFIMGLLGIFFPVAYSGTINALLVFFKLFIGKLNWGLIYSSAIILFGYILLLSGIGGYIFSNRDY